MFGFANVNFVAEYSKLLSQRAVRSGQVTKRDVALAFDDFAKKYPRDGKKLRHVETWTDVYWDVLKDASLTTIVSRGEEKEIAGAIYARIFKL